MKKGVLVFIIIFSFNFSFAGEEPKIIRNNEGVTVVMNNDIQGALKKWDASAEILQLNQFSEEVKKLYTTADPNSLPMATVGDFNGDGIQDLGLLVKTGNFLKAIAAISKSGTYNIVEVKSFSLNEEGTLNAKSREQGIFHSQIYLFTENSKNLKHSKNISQRDGFHIEKLLSADTTVHYAINDSFHEYEGLVK